MHQWTLKSSKEQPNGQGGYGDGFWICPNCETKNAGEVCIICGYKHSRTGKRASKSRKNGPVGNGWQIKTSGRNRICPIDGTENSGVVCTSCGYERPKPWLRYGVIVVSGVAACIIFAFLSRTYLGLIHTHDWQSASCNTPEICSTCGETKGEALGHRWVSSSIPSEHEQVCERCFARRNSQGKIIFEGINTEPGFRTQEDTKSAEALAYEEAKALLASGDNAGAAMAFGVLGDYQDARERSFALWREIVDYDALATNDWITFALRSDGSVISTIDESDTNYDLSGWRDTISISCGSGHVVGLRNDGTVLATGSNYHGECSVSTLRDIVAAEAGTDFSVFLRSDGKVVTVGSNKYGQCNVLKWSNIVGISAGQTYTLGVQKDGTVLAAGTGPCDVSDWTDIVSVYADVTHSVGLRSDGTVVATGNNNYGQCDVQNWTDIVDIAIGYGHTIGLKSNGEIVTAGEIIYPDFTQYWGNVFGSGWTDIVEISAGSFSTIGLRSDGTVVAEGLYNDQGQLNVSEWRDIKLPGSKSQYKPKKLDNSQVSSYFTAENKVFGKLASGNDLGGSVIMMNSPVQNCTSITVCISIGPPREGNVFGEWGFYIRDLDGNWTLAQVFDVDEYEDKVTLKFEEPISFDAWVCPCHSLGSYWNFGFYAWLEDAVVLESNQ